MRTTEKLDLSEAGSRAISGSTGIPFRHIRHSDDIDKSKAPQGWKDARKKIIESIPSGTIAVLLGPRGTGKTQIAADVGLAMHAIGKRVFFAKAIDLFLALRATYNTPNETELDVIEHFARVDLLILDEIQERGETAFEDRVLTDIIDRRYGNMLDTIIIGNLKPKDLASSLGPSIVSRIQEQSISIDCSSWASFRGGK